MSAPSKNENTSTPENIVLLEKENAVAWVTMNRPESLNSLTAELCAALKTALAECEADGDIRVVVLAGEGKAFCAGGDLRTILELADYEAARRYVRAAGEITAAVTGSKKPYIAMVGGAAAGAGFNLALACDFICASKRAKFTQAFSSIGLISDCGGNFLLPRLVGPHAAKRLMMLPETLSAEAAQRLGLVSELADGEALRERAAALAARLAKQPPLALAQIKKLLNGGEELADILRAEEDIQAKLMIGEDCKEGVRAFFEKREAAFKGRS